MYKTLADYDTVSRDKKFIIHQTNSKLMKHIVQISLTNTPFIALNTFILSAIRLKRGVLVRKFACRRKDSSVMMTLT